MKKIEYTRIPWMLLCIGLLLLTSWEPTFSKQKKPKVRLSVQYTKDMAKGSFLTIHTKAKGDHGYHPTPDLPIVITQYFGDSSVVLGEIVTGVDGSAIYHMNELRRNQQDTTNHFFFGITSPTTDKYRSAKKKLDVIDVNLVTTIETVDSLHKAVVNLTSPGTNLPVEGAFVQVAVDRLFRPIILGKDFYKTDENGSIIVPIPDDIPGLNGNLKILAMIKDSDEYGNVQASTQGKIGIPIVENSTFDQRKLWSPPSKTPLPLLIFPNLIILGIWFTLVMLIFNLYKISKSKSD